MVGKLKQVKGVTITGMENLVVFSYINKIAFFDLEKEKLLPSLKFDIMIIGGMLNLENMSA